MFILFQVGTAQVGLSGLDDHGAQLQQHQLATQRESKCINLYSLLICVVQFENC